MVGENDKATDGRAAAKVHHKDRDTGSALRTAYQRTVDEAVPDEMLDLLNQLA